MEWINTEIKLGVVFDPKTKSCKDIIRKIPDDVYHLEISNCLDEIKLHQPYKYIYFITENLDDHDDFDDIKIWNNFIIKPNNNEIAITDYKITDYIIRR